jgi:hypothetical protein
MSITFRQTEVFERVSASSARKAAQGARWVQASSAARFSLARR